MPAEELDRELLAKRRELLKRRPELAAARISRIQSTELEVMRLVDRRIAGGEQKADLAEISILARTLTLTLVGAFRSAWINWSLQDDDRDSGLVVPRRARHDDRPARCGGVALHPAVIG